MRRDERAERFAEVDVPDLAGGLLRSDEIAAVKRPAKCAGDPGM
jgi:hypothetical protein